MLDGYAWPQSVLPGEEVVLHVSAAGPVGVEVARQGDATDVVWTADAIAGTEQPIPPDASADGWARARRRGRCTTCRVRRAGAPDPAGCLRRRLPLARRAHDPGWPGLAVRLLRRDAHHGTGTTGCPPCGPTPAGRRAG